MAIALTACSGRAEPTATPPTPAPAPAPVASSAPAAPAEEAPEEDAPAPPEPPPAATIARMFVLSDPSGQDVYIDEGESSAGTTPLRLSLAPGEHSFSIVFAGDDEDDDIEAFTEETLAGGQEYRFLAVLPNDEDPVEPDAAASELLDVIQAHHASLDACHALSDTADFAFAFDAAGVVTLTQAFGAMPDEPLRCSALEMLSWRLPASASGRYVSFHSATTTPTLAEPRPARRGASAAAPER